MAARAETVGYRRGVVLGFTVAEVVLLFVFCLLLLLAPTVGVERSEGAGDSTASAGPSILAGERGNSSRFPDRQDRRSGEISATTSREQQNQWADIPADWKTIVEGGPVYIPATEICAAAGLRKEDCSPRRIQEVLRSRGEHNWPPIIRLREADGEFFALGRAELTDGFAQKIKREVIPELLKVLADFKVDVVEVVGHTDEQPIQGAATNLDQAAIDVVRRNAPATRLVAADNAGLGYARAISIVQLLRADQSLNSAATILPLSAAQLVDVTGKLADGKNSGDVKERRRIEIRVRRSDNQSAAPVAK